jgi:hypothetical protein
LKLFEVELPLESVALQVTFVVPIGNVEPEAGLHVRDGAGSTVSLALVEKVTTAPPGSLVSTEMSPGTVSVGGVVSRTLIVKEPGDVLPAQSVAVQLTVVVPRGNVDPDGGVQPTEGLGSRLSVAVAVKVTTAPEGPVASTILFDGTVRFGGVVSTVNVNVGELQSLALPTASTARTCQQCVPSARPLSASDVDVRPLLVVENEQPSPGVPYCTSYVAALLSLSDHCSVGDPVPTTAPFPGAVGVGTVGGKVSFVAVFESEALPSLVAVAVYVIVPSASEETSIGVADQFPEPSTVAVTGPTVVVPSVTVTPTLAPGSVVPEADVVVWFAAVTGSVTDVTEMEGSPPDQDTLALACCVVPPEVKLPVTVSSPTPFPSWYLNETLPLESVVQSAFGEHVPLAPLFCPVTVKWTSWSETGVAAARFTVAEADDAWVTLAVTVASPPAVSVWVSGLIEMFGAVVTMACPAIRMYASPQAVVFVPGSVPHVGCVSVASVATASALQSVLKLGKVSWTEQPQFERSLSLKLANAEFDAIRAMAPAQGGLGFSDQVPVPTLSLSSVDSKSGLLPSSQLTSK